jgi:hypothetical protein
MCKAIWTVKMKVYRATFFSASQNVQSEVVMPKIYTQVHGSRDSPLSADTADDQMSSQVDWLIVIPR